MTVLTDTWRQLVQRRLWPVAILLVAALAAVPLLLAKSPAPAPVPPTAGADADANDKGALASQPLVSLASDDGAKRRRVLGSRKDPFAFKAAVETDDASTPTGTTQPTGTGTTGTPDPIKPSGSPTGGAGTPPSTGGGGLVPGAPGPIVDTPSKPNYPLYTLTVRFGDASGDLQRMHVPRLGALPSETEPIVVYLGVSNDRKRAVFLVDSNVIPQGDGVCNPHPASCETIELSEGETEFFDVVGEDGNVSGSFQLDLLDIKTKRTASASVARKHRARESAVGRRALNAHIAESGPLPYRYDRATGTVDEVVVDAEAATAQAGS
jgi:hypothetical protein